MSIKPDPLASEKARTEGNASFKKGRWTEAVGHYTNAIVRNPKDPIGFTNRAAAYLKLEKFEDAIRDTTSALEIDDKSLKALYRRAVALKGLERYDHALQDLDTVLKLDPKNETALLEREEILPLLEKRRAAQIRRKEKSKLPPSPPKSASIELIDNDPPPILSAEKESPATTMSNNASEDIATKTPAASSFASLRKSRDAKKSFSGTNGSGVSPIQSFTAAPNPIAKDNSSLPSNTDGPPNLTRPASTSNTAIQPAQSPSTQNNSVTPQIQSPPTSNPATIRIPAPPLDPNSTSPGAGLHLLRHLSSLSPSSSWSYIQYYPAEIIPIILGPLLEPDILGQLLLAMQHGVSSDATSFERVKTIMEGLKRTPRWKMNTAMLSSMERGAGASAWKACGAEGSWP